MRSAFIFLLLMVSCAGVTPNLINDEPQETKQCDVDSECCDVDGDRWCCFDDGKKIRCWKDHEPVLGNE